MSKIEWTKETWNPITGCTPVSEGCKNCYARRMANRLRGRCGYPQDDPFRVTWQGDRYIPSKGHTVLEEPLHWKKPRKIFVCSMGDLFHDRVYYEWRRRVQLIMEKCPQHIFQVLTKKPDEMKRFYVSFAIANLSWRMPNHIWLGVTAENQRTADERIPILLQIPAAVRFVSVEPMLGAVDPREWFWYDDGPACCDGGTQDNPCGCNGAHQILPREDGLGWVICGGESGPGRRPIDLAWARDLRDQCKAVDVPFFMKQVDKKIPIPDDLMIREYPKGR